MEYENEEDEEVELTEREELEHMTNEQLLASVLLKIMHGVPTTLEETRQLVFIKNGDR